MQKREFLMKTSVAVAAAAFALAGCTTTTPSQADKGDSAPGANANKRREIDAAVNGALDKMYASVKGSRELVNKARGVLVFPSVLQAGFVVGGEYGEGALRVGGATRGYYNTVTASFGLQIGGRTHPLNATPHAVGRPDVWLLGSSDYSARLAASRGLPYVFAHHFSGNGTAEALALYRSEFRPSAELAEPRTFLTVNAVVADSQQEADRLALPQLQAMVALRTGGPLRPQRLVEDAEADPVPDAHLPLVLAMRDRWVIGTPAAAASRLRDLAAEFGVDEVMVHPVAGAFGGTPPDVSPAREATLELLAKELLSSA